MTTRSLKALSREDLEDLVAYYEDVLGVTENVEREAQIRTVWNLPPQAAWMLSRLIAGDGRLFKRDALLDHLPGCDHTQERGEKLVDVLMVKVRRALGADAIETVNGVGWRLTPMGRLRVRQAFGQATGGVAA